MPRKLTPMVHAMLCDDDQPWMANTPDGRCILFLYDEDAESDEPAEINLDLDLLGIPLLTDEARKALGGE